MAVNRTIAGAAGTAQFDPKETVHGAPMGVLAFLKRGGTTLRTACQHLAAVLAGTKMMQYLNRYRRG